MPTRKELIASGAELTPLTREEMFIANALGGEYPVTPITPAEIVRANVAKNAGGGSCGAVIEYGEVTFLSNIHNEDVIVPFNTVHSTAPSIFFIGKDYGDDHFSSYGSGYSALMGINFQMLIGLTFEDKATSPYIQDGYTVRLQKSSSSLAATASASNTTGSTWDYYATAEGIKLLSSVGGVDAGTYKWVAIWLSESEPSNLAVEGGGNSPVA